jgi:hypothetical protein
MIWKKKEVNWTIERLPKKEVATNSHKFLENPD